MATSSEKIFPDAFSWIQILCYDPNFTEVCSLESKWQEFSIGLGKGLAPNRPQAITWTNDEYMRHNGGDELLMYSEGITVLYSS